MKKYIILILVLANLTLLKSQDCNIIDDWVVQNQEPITFSMQHDIFFVNDDVGYTVGVTGTMKKTEDGGENWYVLHDLKESGTRAVLRSVFFINEDVGFVAGDGENYYFQDIFTDAVFMKTVDGGQTWEKTIVDGIRVIHDIRFYDENNGIGLFTSNDGESLITRTNNGGQTWTNIDTELDGFDEYEFISAGTKDLVYGSDSQYNPILIEIDENGDFTNTYNAPSSYIGRFYFYDENIGYASNFSFYFSVGVANSRYKTIDGGETWFGVDMPYFAGHSIIHFADEQNGIITNAIYSYDTLGWEVWEYVEGVEIFKTSDAGLTWDSYGLEDVDCIMLGMSYSSNNNVVHFYGYGREGKMKFINSDNADLEELIVYPNPTSDYLRIKGDLPPNTEIEIISAEGELVSKSALESEFDVNSFPPGVYYVKIAVLGLKQDRWCKFVKM